MAKEPKVKIGDTFGKLTAVKMVDMKVTARGNGNVSDVVTNKTKKGWLCKCSCGGEITLPETTLLKQRSTLRSCDKCPPEKNPNYISNKMTFEDNQDWDELYEYVRTNILGYDKSTPLSPSVVSRLLGILHGKYKVNNKSVDNAKYTYKVALNTFKMCSVDIQRALRTNNFKDEEHKFNYIAKIIENNINDIYVRMKNVERAKEEAKNTMVETFTHTAAKHKSRTKKNDKFSELW